MAAEAGHRLIERLDGLSFEPASILELGCATGRQLQALRKRFGKACIIGLDRSQAMLSRIERPRAWWRPRFERLQADLLSLPLAEDSVDLAYANLTLSWSGNLPKALLEIRRVMKPGGLVLISVLGPDTLHGSPLRQSLLPDLQVDIQTLGSALIKAGFVEPVLDTDWLTTTHSSISTLIDDLLNAGLLASGSASQPQPPATVEPLANQWEIVSASAWAPPASQPMRGSHGDEVSIPIDKIGRRQPR